MIYKNEDGSIYKIAPDYGAKAQGTNKEVAEVLNYLLRKTKHLPEETIELPPPNDGEIVTKVG